MQLVVAISEQEEHAEVVDAAPQKLDQIERGLVGPMEVLEHYNHRPLGVVEHAQVKREKMTAVAIAFDRCEQLAAQLQRHVAQRSQWPRREERVTGAP